MGTHPLKQNKFRSKSSFKHPLEGPRIFHPSEHAGSVTISCYYRRVINMARHRLRQVKGYVSTLNLSSNPTPWLLQNSCGQQWSSIHVILQFTDKMLMIFCSDFLGTCFISSHIHGHQDEAGLWALRLSSPASFGILSVPKAALDFSQTLDVSSNLHAWHD